MCGSVSSRTVCERPRLGRQWYLSECRACRLNFTAPIPSQDDIAAFYQGDYHSDLRITAGTEKAFDSKYQRYADALGRHLPVGRVVDVGCSTGLLVRKLCDRGYDAEGIELNASLRTFWNTRSIRETICGKRANAWFRAALPS